MKKLTLAGILALVVAITAFTMPISWAGLQDRFSKIQLEKDPNNKINMPEVVAPTGNPLSNWGWLYLKDSGGKSTLYFENDSGEVGSVVNTNDSETITAAMIANVTREIYFPMAGWVIDGGADIDEATAPEIGNADNVPVIIWDNSGEVTAIQQTFRLPSTYVSGLTLYCLVSSNTAVGTAGAIDWRIWVNNPNIVFDATAIEQTSVAMTTVQGASADTNNVLLTLALDATGEAALTAGTWITVDIFNATTHATGNLELKGVHGTYTATQ